MSGACRPYIHQFKVKQGGTRGTEVSDALFYPDHFDFESDVIPGGTIINMVEICNDLEIGDDVFPVAFKGWISDPDEPDGRAYYYLSNHHKTYDLDYMGKIDKLADDQYNFSGGRRDKNKNKRKSRKHRGRSRRSRRSRRL